LSKKIINILKYVLFLGIGVSLFFLATLDITQGSLIVDQAPTTFNVGNGLDKNKEGLRLLRIAAVDEEIDGLAFSILQGTKIIYEGQLSADPKKEVECYVPEGQNRIELALPVGEYEIVVEGVDRTDELIADMKRASIPGILVSFLFGYLAIVSRGLRWLIILEPLGYKPNRWRSVHAVAFGYFANTFVPRSGELARCAALNQTDDVPVDKLFGTVISERVVDIMMLMLFMSVAVATNLDSFDTLLSNMTGSGGEDSDGSSKWLILGGAAIAVLMLFLIFRKKIRATAIYTKVKGFVDGVLEGLKSVLNMRRKWAFIGHTLFIWGMYFFMAFVVYMSIDSTSHMTVFQALFVMVAGGFGMVLPAPGGIGSYHWTVKLGFIALGMSGALGFAVANVLWLTQTVMIILGGGIGYLILMLYRIRRDRLAKAND
jgi:uncharacterized membrane protein YbhN (UPF0104 family)